MNVLRLIFLLLVFGAVMLGLSQNTETLGLKSPLELDLWIWHLKSPEMAMYVFIFLCFILGVIFGVITFFPANKEVRQQLKIMRNKLRLVQEDFRTAELERAREIMKRQEKVAPEEEAFREEVVSKASFRAWGKAAMAGCVLLFVILVALYYYGHTEFEKVHEQAAQSEENITRMIEDTRSSHETLDQDFRAADDKLEQLDQDFRTADTKLNELSRDFRVAADKLETLDQDFRVAETKLETLDQDFRVAETKLDELARDFREETAELRETTGSMQEMLDKHSSEISELQLIPEETREFLTIMQLEQYLQTLEYLEKSADTEAGRQLLQEAADNIREALQHYRDSSD
ncbi:hypothetical protein [Desulfonatronospira sp.]|uniref:hypothetical protein n=1 Tax=Desulfonatronospira sp. TaxID=1962951 RepID=UPI0025C0515E|nr:hypothetical protein [Desulfonatronospira sp.]